MVLCSTGQRKKKKVLALVVTSWGLKTPQVHKVSQMMCTSFGNCLSIACLKTISLQPTKSVLRIHIQQEQGVRVSRDGTKCRPQHGDCVRLVWAMSNTYVVCEMKKAVGRSIALVFCPYWFSIRLLSSPNSSCLQQIVTNLHTCTTYYWWFQWT